MGLSPAFIFLSLSVWGKLLGFLGLILALPLTCLGLTYYRRYLWNSERNETTSELKENEPLNGI
jgi:predicted PurR-regulated permease PerM